MLTMGCVCYLTSAHFLNVINKRPAPLKGNLCFTGTIDAGYLELKNHQWLFWAQSPEAGSSGKYFLRVSYGPEESKIASQAGTWTW